ncbi:MAG: hypothetical protein O2897_02510 [bacterium]|nr:hypothetical protein [bacterium]
MTITTNVKVLFICLSFCFSDTSLAMFNGMDADHSVPDLDGAQDEIFFHPEAPIVPEIEQKHMPIYDAAEAADDTDFSVVPLSNTFEEFKESLLDAVIENDISLVEHMLQQVGNLADLFSETDADGTPFVDALFLNCNDLEICRLLMRYNAHQFVSQFFLRHFALVSETEIDAQNEDDGASASNHYPEHATALLAILALLTSAIGQSHY